MFKVEDIIVHRELRKERYTITEIHTDRKLVTVVPFPDVVDIVMPYFLKLDDNLYKIWDYDDVYYRKLKLEKLCSKLEMK